MRKMKKILSGLLMLTALFACENFEKEHPDYEYTAGYFPYQFPVRTLVLGDYIYDNTNDNAHKFVISVAMGGVYENKKNREFTFQVDNSLCDNVKFSSAGAVIQAMPASYYTLSSTSKIVIPSGKLNGGVDVQLADAFFNDPKAITLGYVVPLRLTGSSDVDTILVGSSTNPGADPRIASDWLIAPKNFTMFAVKYINEFHGNYFHYGASQVKDATGTVLETRTYSEKYVENNPVSKLITTARNQVSVKMIPQSAIVTGEVTLLLTFNGKNCTVTAPEGSAYTASGTGEFKSKAYTWGNKSRDGIVLKFSVTKGTQTYEADDVLVIRDRAVTLETYTPVKL
jgi:hypothetical protein